MKQHPSQTGYEITKSVILYNPITGTGHFDSWCALFCNALQEQGWRVFVITPECTAIEASVSNQWPAHLSRATLLDRNTIIQGFIPVFSPFARWRNQLQAKLARGVESAHVDPAHGRRSLAFAMLFSYAATLAVRIANAATRLADDFSRQLFNRRLTVSSTNPLAFAQDIALVRRKQALDHAVTLNLYIDLYTGDDATWRAFDKAMTSDWVGLNIDLTNSLPKPLLAAKSRLRRILYISENTIHFPSSQRPDLGYAWIPDVANVALPASPSDLARRIRQQAGSRKIAFLGGAIGGTKSLSVWYQAMALCDPGAWLFLQVGAVNHSTLTTADRLMLETTLACKPENLVIIDRYLEDERSFNELIALSDVIWGLYRDFDRSSNILAKAASFRKPIIVSAQYLMGKRIRDYGIGEDISDTDPALVAAALNRLAANEIPDAHFDRYLNDFGFPALSRRLDDALKQVHGKS